MNRLGANEPWSKFRDATCLRFIVVLAASTDRITQSCRESTLACAAGSPPGGARSVSKGEFVERPSKGRAFATPLSFGGATKFPRSVSSYRQGVCDPIFVAQFEEQRNEQRATNGGPAANQGGDVPPLLSGVKKQRVYPVTWRKRIATLTSKRIIRQRPPIDRARSRLVFALSQEPSTVVTAGITTH